jgi:hypothetical protein
MPPSRPPKKKKETEKWWMNDDETKNHHTKASLSFPFFYPSRWCDKIPTFPFFLLLFPFHPYIIIFLYVPSTTSKFSLTIWPTNNSNNKNYPEVLNQIQPSRSPLWKVNNYNYKRILWQDIFQQKKNYCLHNSSHYLGPEEIFSCLLIRCFI